MKGLVVRDLNKNFGGITVAKSLNFDLPPGARKALIGPNGAGKSTFANLITGILSPNSGTITLDGENLAGLSEAARVKRGIAKTFQITTLFRNLTVRENLRLPILERTGQAGRWFGRASRDRAVEREIEDLLAAFELAPLAERKIEGLAYGQQRLVEMALTLALKPRVLILDEPAAGVPSSDSHLITDAIARLPKDLAVLIIEHDMDLVFRVADQIVVLVAGAILTEGTPEEIAANRDVQTLYLGGGAAHG